MLMIDYIDQIFKKGNGGIGIKQTALKFIPITAMQIFGNKDAAVGKMREVTRE